MTDLVVLERVGMQFRVRKGLFRRVQLRAVDDVTLHLRRGESLALVGESGCGKTTLGRLTLRVLRPTSGRIYFDGQDLTDIPESGLRWFRRRAQAVFQDPYSSMDPFMNAYQILEEPLRLHAIGEGSERRRLVLQALDEVRLTPPDEFARKYPHMMSGGQRQRLGIARALMLDPEYIMADEPVSMIDASSRAEILLLLNELQSRRGLTFLYITHDLATARYFAHRVAVMYLGRVVELGPATEVLRQPRHPYAVALRAAVPTVDPANRLRERPVIAGEPPSAARIPSGCRFHPRCPYFMQGVCDILDPRLQEIGPGVFAACHLYPLPPPGFAVPPMPLSAKRG